MTYCITALTKGQLEQLVGPNFVVLFQQKMNTYINAFRDDLAKGRPLCLGKEAWEYAVSDAIQGSDWNGAGHSFIDVKIGNDIGIDVKGVSKVSTSKKTTEASMYQNFNQNAKTAFTNADAEGVWSIHVDGWLSKIKEIKDYYILGIIRDKDTLNCSLCGFKVTDINLKFDPSLISFNKASFWISGISDPDFIDVRYYNSKSRLEILFKEKCWTDQNYHMDIYKF